MGLMQRIRDAMRRRRPRGTSDERHIAQLARNVHEAPPLTVVFETYDNNTVGLGVRLDTSVCKGEG